MTESNLKGDLEQIDGLSRKMARCISIAMFCVGLLLSLVWILPIKVMVYLSIFFAFVIAYSGSLFYAYRKEQKMVIDFVKRKMEKMIAA